MSVSPDSKLTRKALAMAFESRGKPKVFHADQRSHYTSRFIDNYCGVIKSIKAYRDEVIAGTTVRWSGSSEV